MTRWLERISTPRQFGLGIGAVTTMVLISLAVEPWVGYQAVAFFLLVTVSVLALFLEIIPLVSVAILSAMLWDFLFIPPRFTFSVGTRQDQLLLLMYLLIVLIHSVLSFRIRQIQREVQKREERARDLKFYNALLNSLSHELRTPITTIMGASDNLLTATSNLNETDRAELLKEISTASIRLNRQVENLLGMSRLEAGAVKIKKDWVDIHELIYTTLAQFEPNNHQHNIKVSASESLPLFKLDFALMEQALFNLVNNAIQHTPAGVTILVHADCVDEKLLLVVSDTGQGFSAKEIEKAFDKFYRAKGARPGGTGLGLSIVRGFVEAHGGTVSLRNLPLSGAEFAISIPTEVTYLNRLKNE